MGEEPRPWAANASDQLSPPDPAGVDPELDLIVAVPWLSVAPGVQVRADGAGASPSAGRSATGEPPGGAHGVSGGPTVAAARVPEGSMRAASGETGAREAAPRAGGAPGERPALSLRLPGPIDRGLRVVAVAFAVTVVLAVLLVGWGRARGWSLPEAPESGRSAPAGTSLDRDDRAPSTGTEPDPPTGGGSPGTDIPAPGAAATDPGGGAAGGARAPGSTGGQREGPWAPVLAALDERRGAALRSGSAAAVGGYAAVGSPYHAAEQAVLRSLADAALQPAGWAVAIISATGGVPAGAAGDGTSDVEVPAEALLVTVTDERSAYRLVDGAGATVREIPAAGQRRWVVTLVPGTAAGSQEPSDESPGARGGSPGGDTGSEGVGSGDGGHEASGSGDDGREDSGSEGGSQGEADARSAIVDDLPPTTGSGPAGPDATGGVAGGSGSGTGNGNGVDGSAGRGAPDSTSGQPDPPAGALADPGWRVWEVRAA